MTLYELLKSINNYFSSPKSAISDTFTIKNKVLSLPFIGGQHFIIEGSRYNDNRVYVYGIDELIDETFTGVITPLDIPAEVLELYADITVWQNANKGKESDKVSESFGGYSYTKGTTASGKPYGWREVFADRLKVWRKI